jgi:hypothetical protein
MYVTHWSEPKQPLFSRKGAKSVYVAHGSQGRQALVIVVDSGLSMRLVCLRVYAFIAFDIDGWKRNMK